MEADRRSPVGVPTHDDMQLPEENMSAKAAHTKIRCPILAPDRDGDELWFTGHQELCILADLEEKH